MIVRPDMAADLPAWLQPMVDVGKVTHPWLWDLTPPADGSGRPASVLILFGEGAHGPEVLLLERSHDMRSHPGQIAFPGGSQDPDDSDEVGAALREAQEETGLDPAGVQVFGLLPPLWLPPSNFVVTPVLGWWRVPSPVRAVDPAETASVHKIPVEELLDAANRVTIRHPMGHKGPAFLVRGLTVWGFTAGILDRLFTLAQWNRPWDSSRIVDLPERLVRRSMGELEREQVEP